MRAAVLVLPLILLAACNRGEPDTQATASGSPSQAAASPSQAADPLLSHDGMAAGIDIPDSEPRPVMQAQVMLDRLGFTPGVVDGKSGLSTRNAISGFQESRDLPVTGELDEATKAALATGSEVPATRVVTIPAEFAAGPFSAVPKEPSDQAKMPALAYASLDEKLAERFHTTVATLKLLNPGGVPAGATASPGASASASPTASPSPTPTPSGSGSAFTPQPGPVSVFKAGQQIRVPNVGADRIDSAAVDDGAWLTTLAMLGVGTDQPKVERVVVSKSKGTLKAYDASDKLVAVYTATMGSQYDPLPLGKWKVNGVSRNPDFNYNPDLFWDAQPGDKKAKLPPGPNGPVGVVWIDLSKEHYGIHGTPNPETIGRAQSHGCVRLTYWDAARLAQMVKPGTQVIFEA